MDDLETVISCPLGSSCREVKDGKVHQCAWYVQMKGTDAQGEEHDRWGCAMSWMPVLITEVAGEVRGTAASVQSMRNLQDDRQREAIKALGEANARIT